MMKGKLTNKINFFEETKTSLLDWQVIIPNSIEYYGKLDEYARPIYYNKPNKNKIEIRLGDHCQFCGWNPLENHWRIETDTKWAIVGSECWKRFNVEFRDSKNVIRDVAWKKIRDMFIKHKNSLLQFYWEMKNNGSLINSHNYDGYKYSKTLKNLNQTSTANDMRYMIIPLSKILILKLQLPQELKNVLRIIPTKGLRQIWI